MIVNSDTNPVLSRFLSLYKLQAAGSPTVSNLYELNKLLDVSKLKLHPEISSLTVAATSLNDGVEGFYWPFGETNLDVLHICNHIGYGQGCDHLLLKSWDEIPSNVVNLRVDGMKIITLKGIEQMSVMKTLYFCGGNTPCIVEGGLLRLLKLPALESVCTISMGDPQLTDALDIVQSHLVNRNVPECQQELIEAGLQEYAKL